MSDNQLILNEYFQMKSKEIENSNPWLVYVAEKSRTSCMKCQENHAKRFRSLDPNKPTLPIHPNCKCKYVELSKATDEMTVMRSIKMYVRDEPKYVKRAYSSMFNQNTIDLSVLGNIIMSEIDTYGYGFPQYGFSITSIDNMLDILEKNCKPGTLGELIIVGHGEKEAFIALGNGNSRLDAMSETQINRLYNLLSPNAIIDLRFCYGVDHKLKEKIVQDLANKLRCRILAYKNQVSQSGKKPDILKDDTIPWTEKVFHYSPKKKIFYPK